MELKYNADFDYYGIGTEFKNLNVRVATKDTVQKYMNGQFAELFDEFKPKSDSVEIIELAGEAYFVHQRSAEKSSKEVFARNESEKKNTLPSGIYKFDYKMNEGLIVKPINNLEMDDYINLANSDKTVGEDIQRFLNNREVFERRGMEYSRGSLAYGPQGTGKTMTIMKSVNEIVSERDDTVAFVITSDYPRYFDEMSDYKKIIEGNQNVIFIIEEITDQAEDFETILSFLDGEHSWTRSYSIATTNYPNSVPENVIDRPGRFDNIYEFSNPGADDRRKYFEKQGVDYTEEVIKQTEGFSVAHLKEIILKSDLYNQSMTDTIQEMKELKEKIQNDFSNTDTLDRGKAKDVTKS